jgi:hypothetical protein
MQRSVSPILGTGEMKTKAGQNTNEFNYVDLIIALIWTPVKNPSFIPVIQQMT